MSSDVILLSRAQAKIVELVRSGNNIFFTGPAGSGKSCVLRSIRSSYEVDGLYFVAPTGSAAANIGGSTIHSFAGIGLGKGSPLDCLDKCMKNSKAVQRWIQWRCLVVDEISMVSAELFDKLDFIAKRIRKSQEPFGGIQLGLCGDFFQLPPVRPKHSIEPVKFCFQSPLWNETMHSCVELTQIHRQNEEQFISFLCKLRKGTLDANEGSIFLRRLCRPLEDSHATSDDLESVTLYPRRVDAKLTNIDKIQTLPGDAILHISKDAGQTGVLDRECAAPRVLRLKTNVRVMLLVNLTSTLVNGLMGNVIGSAYGTPIVRFDNKQVKKLEPFVFRVTDAFGVTIATRLQVPLDLAYAVTIHKSQGLTLKKVRLSLTKLFESGQGYTALSRCPSSTNVEIIDFDHTLFNKKPNQKVIDFYNTQVVSVEESPLLPHRPLTICTSSLDDLLEDAMNVGVGSFPNEDTGIPAEFETFHSLPCDLIERIFKNALDNEVRLESTKKDLSALLIPNTTIPCPAISSFLTWFWEEVRANIDVVGSINKKDINNTMLPTFHNLLASTEVRATWKVALSLAKHEDPNGSEKPINLVNDRLTMTLILRSVFKLFIEEVCVQLFPAQRDNTALDNSTTVPTMSPEMRGTVRYIAGWTLHKEKQSCARYIVRNDASKNERVRRRCVFERKVRETLKTFCADKSDVMENTSDKASIERLALKDRGCLTLSTDPYFIFCLKLQHACDVQFTLQKFEALGQIAISETRNNILNDCHLSIEWYKLFDNTNCQNDLGGDAVSTDADLLIEDIVGIVGEEDDYNESDDESDVLLQSVSGAPCFIATLDTSEVSNEMSSHLLKNDNQESIAGVLFDRIIGRYLNVIQKRSIYCSTITDT